MVESLYVSAVLSPLCRVCSAGMPVAVERASDGASGIAAAGGGLRERRARRGGPGGEPGACASSRDATGGDAEADVAARVRGGMRQRARLLQLQSRAGAEEQRIFSADGERAPKYGRDCQSGYVARCGSAESFPSS